MTDDQGFLDFMRRVRAGDQSAADELVHKYERLIRREVRVSLDDSRLSRLFDSMDILQSVMCSFFVRVIGGEYELDNPRRLMGLLVTMTRNKVISTARRQLADKRDGHRRDLSAGAFEAHPVGGESPSQVVALAEIVERCQNELTEDERLVAELRSQSFSWQQIAEQLGGTANGRRMQMSRATSRLCRQFDLEIE